MRRLIAGLVLLLLVGSAVPSWAATTFFWRAEGTTLSGTDDLPGADTAASTTGSPAINATAALVGSNGILIDAASEYYALDSESAVINAGEGAIGFWIRVQTFTGGALVMQYNTHSTLGNNYIRVSLDTTTNNHIRMTHRNSDVGSSGFDCTTAISNNTTYFVVLRWDQSASDRYCAIYDSGGSLVGSNSDLTTGWTTPYTSYPVTDGMKFGESSGTSVAFYLDNIFLATTLADGDTIYCNRGITSYTGYAACSSGVTPRGMMMGVYP